MPNTATGSTTPIYSAPVSAITPRKILHFLSHPDPEDEEDNVPLGYQVLTNREGERVVEERERQA
jgi:hypothetical protein